LGFGPNATLPAVLASRQVVLVGVILLFDNPAVPPHPSKPQKPQQPSEPSRVWEDERYSTRSFNTNWQTCFESSTPTRQPNAAKQALTRTLLSGIYSCCNCPGQKLMNLRLTPCLTAPISVLSSLCALSSQRLRLCSLAAFGLCSPHFMPCLCAPPPRTAQTGFCYLPPPSPIMCIHKLVDEVYGYKRVSVDGPWKSECWKVPW